MRSQNVSYVLPVMIVKDPLTWFKSMCRNAYAARFSHPPGCPSPLEATHGPVAWQPDRKCATTTRPAVPRPRARARPRASRIKAEGRALACRSPPFSLARPQVLL